MIDNDDLSYPTKSLTDYDYVSQEHDNLAKTNSAQASGIKHGVETDSDTQNYTEVTEDWTRIQVGYIYSSCGPDYVIGNLDLTQVVTVDWALT